MSPSNSAKTSRRPLLYVLLALFIVFHNDLWWWDDPTFVFGLPITLTYHLAYCLAAAGLMALLTRFAWPELDEGDGEESDFAETMPSKGHSTGGAS